MTRRTPVPPLSGCFPPKLAYLFLAFLVQAPVARSIVVKTRLALAGNSNSTATTGAEEPGARAREEPSGKVFFLFLAEDGLPNEEIWTRFFATARPGVDFEALVHCKNEEACRRGVGTRGLFQVIPTVPSKWCEDLVGPMDALLQAALEAGSAGSGTDSFTFISDTTIPVKPFKTVSQRLGLDRMRGSSFCVAPRFSWGFLDSDYSTVVKHSQWLTLSREHARRVVDKKHQFRNLMMEATPEAMEKMLGRFLATGYQATFSKLFGRLPLNGCLDEYLYFALVYGFIDGDEHKPSSERRVNGLLGAPLSMSYNSTQDFQGQCDTFVFWGYGNKFQKLASVLEAEHATQLELPEWGHPAFFRSVSTTALQLLHKSEFLFARKLDSRSVRVVGQETAFTSLPDAFDKYIFSE